MKRSKDIAALSKTELQNRFNEMEKELMKQRAQVAMGTPPKKSSSIRDLKKNMARLITCMRRK